MNVSVAASTSSIQLQLTSQMRDKFNLPFVHQLMRKFSIRLFLGIAHLYCVSDSNVDAVKKKMHSVYLSDIRSTLFHACFVCMCFMTINCTRSTTLYTMLLLIISLTKPQFNTMKQYHQLRVNILLAFDLNLFYRKQAN